MPGAPKSVPNTLEIIARFNPLCAGSSGAGRRRQAQGRKPGRHVSIPYARGVVVQAVYKWLRDECARAKFQSPMRGE